MLAENVEGSSIGIESRHSSDNELDDSVAAKRKATRRGGRRYRRRKVNALARLQDADAASLGSDQLVVAASLPRRDRPRSISTPPLGTVPSSSVERSGFNAEGIRVRNTFLEVAEFEASTEADDVVHSLTCAPPEFSKREPVEKAESTKPGLSDSEREGSSGERSCCYSTDWEFPEHPALARGVVWPTLVPLVLAPGTHIVGTLLPPPTLCLRAVDVSASDVACLMPEAVETDAADDEAISSGLKQTDTREQDVAEKTDRVNRDASHDSTTFTKKLPDKIEAEEARTEVLWPEASAILESTLNDVLDAFDPFNGSEWLPSPQVPPPQPLFKAVKCRKHVSGEAKPEALIEKSVRLLGLSRKPEFNGQWGKVEAYDPESGRFSVHVRNEDGSELRAKLHRRHFETRQEIEGRMSCEPGDGVAAKAPLKVSKPKLSLPQPAAAQRATVPEPPAAPVRLSAAADAVGWRPSLRSA